MFISPISNQQLFDQTRDELAKSILYIAKFTIFNNSTNNILNPLFLTKK